MSKKDQILTTALDHFTTQGFNGSSTRRIAMDADVSEALIFKHFHFKDGLIDALFETTADRFGQYLESAPEHPTELVQYCMELPLTIPEEDRKLWIFLYRLRWQDPKLFNKVFEPMRNKLEEALGSLRFPKVEIEAELILSYIHGLAISTLNGGSAEPTALLQVLRLKYVAS